MLSSDSKRSFAGFSYAQCCARRRRLSAHSPLTATTTTEPSTGFAANPPQEDLHRGCPHPSSESPSTRIMNVEALVPDQVFHRVKLGLNVVLCRACKAGRLLSIEAR